MTGFEVQAHGPQAVALAKIFAAPAEVIAQGVLCTGADVDEPSFNEAALADNRGMRWGDLEMSQTCTHDWY